MADKETIALNTEKEYITTFTTPADLTDVRFLAYSFYGNNDGSATGSAQGEIDLTEVMLVEGTYTTETFPDYEPYGVSPSPDYPSKINNVGEAINSFDIGELVKLSTDYSEVENGYIFMARLKMNTTGVTLKKPISLPASLSYTIKNGTGTNFRFKLWFDNDTSMSFDNYKSGTEADVIKNIAINNITQTGATKITKITIDYSDAGTFTLTNFMINEGTTVKPYSPYGEGSINIKTHSGNYFDLSKYIGIPCVLNGTAIVTNTEITIKASSNNVTYTTIGLGNTGSVIAEAYRQYCMEIPEGANKLIVNFKNNNTARLASIYYNVLDENYRVLSGIPRIYNSTDEEGILQADININNAKYLLVRFDAATGGDVTYKNILLGKIDSYTPYEEQNKVITLAKPLYQDCYLAEDGIHYTRKQIVLDGSEDEGWSLSATNTSNQNRFTSKIIENEVKRPSNADEIANIICSHFIKESANDTYRRSDGIAIHPNGSIYLYYNAFKEYTISEFKTWLSNNPITLEYELAEEVINPYTDDISMLITQYDNITNISNSDNAEMEVELTKNKAISSINENIGNLQEKDNDLNDRINEVNTNLNDKINGTVLYNNSGGTKETITLSKSVVNFKKIGIEYKDTRMGITNYVEVIEPNGKMINLLSFQSLTNKYITASAINISGNAITWEFNYRIKISDGVVIEDQWNLITKVIGYIY